MGFPSAYTDGALADAMAYVIQQKGFKTKIFWMTSVWDMMRVICYKFLPRKLSVLFDGTKDGVPKTPVWAEKKVLEYRLAS